MPRLNIATETRIYRVSPDDPMPPAGRFRALIIGRVVDELTNESPATRAEIRVREPGFAAKVNWENLFTVSGIPIRCLPLLAPQLYDIHVTLRAPGYIAMEATAQVDLTQAPPGQLPPLVELNLLVHREPVVIAGRVVEKTPASMPVPGATVRVTHSLATLPPPNVSSPQPDPLNFVSVRSPIYSPRNALTGQGRPVTLTPTGAPGKVLTFSTAPGDKTVGLDNRIGLNSAGGDLLWIDSGTDAEEFIATTKVLGASIPDQPGEATLAFGLRNAHHRDTAVTIVAPLSPGAIKFIARPAIPGDSVLFLSDLGGWVSATAVEINGGPAAEYHLISQFTTTTDSGGFYRLPPISRAAMVQLEAQGLPGKDSAELSLDYTKPINHVDFRLQP
jgi:hypothetical protein